LNGNFGLDYKLLMGSVLSSSMGFNNSKAKDFKQINYGGKVLMFKEVQLIML
jgi:hypothetical protein